MEEFRGFFANKYVISFLLIVTGYIVATIFDKIRHKTGIFGYISNFNRVGLSADDQIFGSLVVTWQGSRVDNLYLFTIELENSTLKDYDNVNFRVYSDPFLLILNEKTEVVNTVENVPWANPFHERMGIYFNQQLQQRQAQPTDEYYHNREYLLPVFNRGHKLRFSYLCTVPLDNNTLPDIHISTITKGVRLKKLRNPYVILNPIWGVPHPVAFPRALIIALLVILLCGMFINDVWLAAFIAMVVGLTAQILGSAMYKIENAVKNIITG